MKFLKFIVATALAFLLWFLLGNIMSYAFPGTQTKDTTKSCYDQFKDPKREAYNDDNDAYLKAWQENQDKRSECQKTQTTAREDQQALAFQQALLRAVVTF